MMIPIADFLFDGPYESRERLENRPGVFTIICVDRGTWYLLDVDHSDDAKSAVENHPREPLWEKYKKGEVRYAVLYSESSESREREAIERAIRDEYENIPCKPDSLIE